MPHMLFSAIHSTVHRTNGGSFESFTLMPWLTPGQIGGPPPFTNKAYCPRPTSNEPHIRAGALIFVAEHYLGDNWNIDRKVNQFFPPWHSSLVLRYSNTNTMIHPPTQVPPCLIPKLFTIPSISLPHSTHEYPQPLHLIPLSIP